MLPKIRRFAHGTAAILFLIPKAVFADSDPHAMGLIPPSPEQERWERQHLIIPQRIKLNTLGYSRVNAHRSALGEEPLALPSEEIAPLGEEVVGATEEENARGGPVAEPLGAPTALPPSVDNSTLKYFPPIRSQGGLGSCAQWSSMYYCFTHMNAFARDLDAKNGGDAYRFSPKFTYNMLNSGNNQGTWLTDGWTIATKNGAATWTDWPTDSDFRAWPLTATVWRNALNVRVNTTGSVPSCDTPTGLSQLKTLLMNGYVLTFATYIGSWQFKLISDDPSTSSDNAFVGKEAAYWINGSSGGHAMTVVGYNDDIWVDINGNGTVDAGEKGALRIANSWGTSWEEAGFTWLAYDALKTVSGVTGGPSAGRGPAWWRSSSAYWVTAKSVYNPTALAQFTLSHAKRNDLRVYLGMSDTTQTSPSTTWSPDTVLQNAGGDYAFNGGITAVDATFVFDFSDLASVYGTAKRWYLRVQDIYSGNATTLKSFKWINGADTSEVALTGLPATFDNTLQSFYVDATLSHGAGNTPPTLSALANQTVSEDSPTDSLTFTVGDAQTPAASLTVSGTSNNATLVPSSNIAIVGADSSRTVVVTPAANQNGTATITLTATDGGGLTAQTTFLLTVNAVNDRPVAEAQVLGVQLNTPKSIILRATDIESDPLTFSPTSPSHGTLTGTAPTLTYTPNTGYIGPDSISFTASDGLLTSIAASVTLMIDTTPPSIAIPSPSNGATVSYAVSVTANASDDVGVERVVFLMDGATRATATLAPYSYFWDCTDSSNGPHILSARAYDNAGNSTLSALVNVTVANGAASELLVTPTALSFYGVQGGSTPPAGILAMMDAQGGTAFEWTVATSLPWLSVSPTSGHGPEVFSVGVNQAGLALGTVTGTIAISLVPVGTGDAPSLPLLVPVSLTVAANSDTTPPTIPTGLAAVATGPGQALLSWSASTDTGGSGVARYRLYRDGVEKVQPTLPHFTDTDLTAGTPYDYAVSAVDNAGNSSALSGVLQFTASSEGTPAGLFTAYSYPDPALHGTPPVIRAILGDVDNVEITIYDMQGKTVHSARLDAPNAIVDGKAAYDYPWTGDIPSGVYYAVIHGKAGNETVKARTRLTVAR